MNFDFADILLKVVEHKASDLHITAGAPPTIRVRGSLRAARGHPSLTPTDTREIVYAILNSSQRQRLETDWQLDFAYSVPGHGALPRQHLLPARHARRRLPPDPVRDGADREARPAAGRARVRHEAARHRPRDRPDRLGQVDHARLADQRDQRDARRAHHHRSRTRSSSCTRTSAASSTSARSGSDAQTFALALKAALRQDPDVILVGEMRDMETIGTALTAAETGHLVFATLHTQDAPQTVDRIIDVFPPAQQGQIRAQLAIGLQGIVTQTLLPTADGQGRCVAAEVLVPTPGVRNLIREGKTHQIYSLHPDRRRRRHADDGRLAGGARAARPRSRWRSPSRARRSRPSCAASCSTPAPCRAARVAA